MFDQETLGQLREAVKGEVRTVVREEIQEQLQEIRGELKAVREDIITREEVRSIVREEVLASEKRVIHTVVDMVGTMIDDNILPQFDEVRQDIASIKRGRWQLA